MAGGSGTRFWPASRERLPKQFLNITTNRSMLEETLDRVRSFAPPEKTYAVIGEKHNDLITDRTACKVLIEPFGRNTAACIALAAIHVNRIDPDEPIAILPADHFVSDVQGFANTIEAGSEIASKGNLVAIGIDPTRSETGYGYLELGEEVDSVRGIRCFRMARFEEKPNAETAQRFSSSGRHLWNGGIFIFTARTILRELRACLPALASEFDALDAAIGSPDYNKALRTTYERVESISIDYGVMERTKAPVYALKATFAWSDVGSWQALYELRAAEADGKGNLLLGNVKTIDSASNLVFSNGKRLIALLGVDDLMIVDTGDVLMVGKLNRSQDVKRLTELIKSETTDPL